MVVDLTDPNRPRFTLQELRDVLQERNKLKSQLLVVQEELQCYKRWGWAAPGTPHRRAGSARSSLTHSVFVPPFTWPVYGDLLGARPCSWPRAIAVNETEAVRASLGGG